MSVAGMIFVSGLAPGAVTSTYGANGNLTNDGIFTYGYDAENRMGT